MVKTQKSTSLTDGLLAAILSVRYNSTGLCYAKRDEYYLLSAYVVSTTWLNLLN